MNNQLLQIKIKERLNKLDSDDYENITCWQIQEAFNKAQREWVRRQIDGINQKREGRESSSQSIADLQNLLNAVAKNFNIPGLKATKDTRTKEEMASDTGPVNAASGVDGKCGPDTVRLIKAIKAASGNLTTNDTTKLRKELEQMATGYQSAMGAGGVVESKRNWINKTREKSSNSLFERLVKDASKKKVI